MENKIVTSREVTNVDQSYLYVPRVALVTVSQEMDVPVLEGIQTIIVVGIIKDLDKF